MLDKFAESDLSFYRGTVAVIGYVPCRLEFAWEI